MARPRFRRLHGVPPATVIALVPGVSWDQTSGGGGCDTQSSSPPYFLLHPAAPFDLLALFVSHCMLPGESDPPHASGVRWSTSYPGHALLVEWDDDLGELWLPV